MKTNIRILLTVVIGMALLYGLLILIALGWGTEHFLIARIAAWGLVILLMGHLVNAWWQDRTHPGKPNG